MKREHDIVIPESVMVAHDISVEYEPGTGTIKVLVDGSQRLKVDGYSGIARGSELVFRTIDSVEFRNFKVEELP